MEIPHRLRSVGFSILVCTFVCTFCVFRGGQPQGTKGNNPEKQAFFCDVKSTGGLYVVGSNPSVSAKRNPDSVKVSGFLSFVSV